MSPQSIRRILIGGTVLLSLGGLYSLMWMVSSASLACGACNCEYSLFAESFRCRQPDIAIVLALTLFTAAWLLGRASKRFRAESAQKASDSRTGGDAA
jgi:hypothetical protein